MPSEREATAEVRGNHKPVKPPNLCPSAFFRVHPKQRGLIQTYKRCLLAAVFAVALLVPAGALAAGPSKADKTNAAKQCRAEACAQERGTRRQPGAFAAKYGTNPNKSNAFGKCVSQKASA